MEKLLFSNKMIQVGRLLEMSLVKGLAHFSMIFVHVFGENSALYVHDTWLGNIVEFFGSPLSAPVFMMCMGVGMIYSSKSDPMTMFKRGLKLIYSGYVFNVVRYVVPIILAGQLGLDMSNSPLTWFEHLVAIDILHFAGLAHIVVALLKTTKLEYKYYGLLALVLAFVSPLVYGLSTGNEVMDVILAPLFSSAENVWFPLFPWLTYVVFGMFFGDLVSRTTDRAVFYKYASIVATPVFIIGLLMMCWNQEFWTQEFFNKIFLDEYYQHSTGMSLFIMGLDTYFIALLFFFGSKIPKRMHDELILFGDNINDGYYVQYAMVGWVAAFTSFSGLNFIQTFAMIVVTVITCHCYMVEKKKKRVLQKNKISKQQVALQN